MADSDASIGERFEAILTRTAVLLPDLSIVLLIKLAYMIKRRFRVLTATHLVVLWCKVADQLTADGRHYDGRQVTEILRAIRNVAEHWFQPRTVQEEAALEVRLTHLPFMLSVRGRTRIERSLRMGRS